MVGLAHGVTLKYLGCYDDNFDDRDLGNLNEDELQTVEKCVALCASSVYLLKIQNEFYLKPSKSWFIYFERDILMLVYKMVITVIVANSLVNSEN